MHRTLGCAHATTTFHLHRLRARLGDGERGQGTVEYIALILLLAAVFAAVAAFSGGAGVGKKLAQSITDQVTGAIDAVAGGAKK